MIVTRPRVDANIATANCTIDESIGDLVYVNSGKIGADYSVRKVDINDYNKMPAIAVVIFKISTTRAVIQFGGETSIFSGLIPGKVYWISDASIPTDVPPVPGIGERKYWQNIGVAVDNNIINLNFLKDLKNLN